MRSGEICFPGCKREQMGDVAVIWFGRVEVPILAPLHQLSAATDLGRTDSVARTIQGVLERIVRCRIPAAAAVFSKSSQMICRSTALPAHAHPRVPSSVLNAFSGEVEGLVMSLPFASIHQHVQAGFARALQDGVYALRGNRDRA